MLSNKFPRRSFLKTAAAAPAAAVAAAPAMLAGAEATKKFRLGMIGMGRRGRNNLRSILKHPELDVVAFSEVYKPNLDLALGMVPEAKVYSDFRDLIAASDIDAICICTPDHWHAYMTVEACKAGKDVYVEKPISVVVEEGRMMVKAARKYNRIVQVGTQQRSGQHFQKVVEMIQGGKIGDIAFVRTWNYSNELPEEMGNPPDTAPPADLDWNMWLGPAAERPFNKNRFGVDPTHYSHFRWFWDYAGGMMTDWGIHLLDIVMWAMDVEGPSVISTLGGKFLIQDNRETPDLILANYEFPKFVCVYENRITNGQSMFDRDYGITFHGSKGTLFVDRQRYEIIPEMKGLDPRGYNSEALMVREEGRAVNHSTDDHWKDFISSMKSRKPPISDIEIGHRSTAMALLGNVSLRSRQRVEWDPKTETTPNKEAQTYLSRPYRAPWKLTL